MDVSFQMENKRRQRLDDADAEKTPFLTAVNSVQKRKDLFEKFVNLFFLVGITNVDWIPISSTNSPLFTLFESLVQPRFLLPRESRKERLCLTFLGGDPANVKAIKKRVATRDAFLTDGPLSHVCAFDGRRLPQIANYSSEVEPIRAWLEVCHEENLLRPSSVEESFSICIREIGRYVLVSPERRLGNQRAWNYQGFPKTLCMDGERRTSNDSIRAGADFDHEMEDQGSSNAEVSSDVASGENGELQIAGCDGVQGNVQDVATATSTDEMDVRVHEACELFESAINDNVYMTVSVLFDEEVGYHCVAAGYLEVQNRHSRQKIPVTPLMEDILTYSHWKSFRVKDAEDHQKREERLLETKEVFDRVRGVFDMRTYSEMRWSCEERQE